MKKYLIYEETKNNKQLSEQNTLEQNAIFICLSQMYQ
jgi:hypothetical protein